MNDSSKVWLPWPKAMELADALDRQGYTQLAREARGAVWNEAARLFALEVSGVDNHVNNNREALNLTHTGGITEVIMIAREDLPRAIDRLTDCHSHVFVIDQSKWSFVSLGVSIRGLDCLRKVGFDGPVQRIQ